jgi:hypothetical protein
VHGGRGSIGKDGIGLGIVPIGSCSPPREVAEAGSVVVLQFALGICQLRLAPDGQREVASATLCAVTKLNVDFVAPSSLPNDRRIIVDERSC